MNKICFVLDSHYPNYTKRLQQNILKYFLDLNLSDYGFGLLVSTNRPEDFKDIENESVKVYDIDELRKDYPISLQYEILPENPAGIYPSKFPWNLERFIVRKAAELGYNYVINLDSDVVLNFVTSAEQLLEILNSCYQENVLATNQALYHYTKNSQNEIFHLHEKYINHFNLNFDDAKYTTLDGPVLVFMGKTSEDIIRFVDIWNEFVEFGYTKEHGFGYENIVCGNWSLTIPVSGFELKWMELPFVPHHNYEDRY
jgi:hypothetical protein